MGKSRSQRKSARLFDSDDDSLSSSSTTFSDKTALQEVDEVKSVEFQLEFFLDSLYEKRGSTREKSLKGLIDAFTNHLQLEFTENNCITLLHQFINSIKRGSSSEAMLASHALGLLSITVGSGDNAHEIMEESIPHLSQALKTGSESRKRLSALDCLAIATFVGGNDPEETEKSMELLWQLIHPKLGSNVVVANKPTPAVIAAAISAWSFLLTTIPRWNANSYNWSEYISLMSNLLDKDDRSVRIAAGEAIALIFEIASLRKPASDGKSSTLDNVLPQEDNSQSKSHVDAFRGNILNRVRDLSIEAGGKGSSKKDLNNQHSSFRDILEFLEIGDSPETSIKLQHGQILKVSTWSQLIQLNFLKNFLGSGFQKHMQENELLHDVFGFTPRNEKQRLLSSKEKRLFKSPNSEASKARTQFLNKQRARAQDANNGHYAVDVADEGA